MKRFHFALILAGLLLLGSSCKPKQSAYKQVYEAAKEREIQQSASQPTTVIKDASPLPPVEVSVRKEKVEPENLLKFFKEFKVAYKEHYPLFYMFTVSAKELYDGTCVTSGDC